MIIVLGASGFIGTYLVDELLDQGYELTITGRNMDALAYFQEHNIPMLNVDISKADDLNKLPTDDIEAVVLMAGLLPANVKDYNPYDYVKINIEGTINVLEYCRKNNIKKIISTTTYADVQKLWEKDKAITEAAARDFYYTGDHAMYVISKNAASDIIEHYDQEYGITGIVFRLPPVYGFGPHGAIYVDGKYNKSGIQTFIDNAIDGKPIEIWGNGTISRDVVYVKDVVNALVLAIQSDKAQGLYNITSGQAVSLEEQVRSVIEVFSRPDKQSEIVFRPEKENNSASFIFDINKAKNDFAYEPKYLPFKKMLEDHKQEMESGRFNFLSKRAEK
ncbi:MAG: NAD(P)-dependent oxidoreductase [Syntrophomonadaceae bacterium]|nr:NAD(P)-dependent oxidoreductase [Syntrophomonadaceae bacterium]